MQIIIQHRIAAVFHPERAVKHYQRLKEYAATWTDPDKQLSAIEEEALRIICLYEEHRDL